MDILVTGGTGTLGRYVAAGLTSAGHAVRVLSRREHADSAGITYLTGNLRTGDGVAEAVADAAGIIHCASERTGDAATTACLVRAARAGGASPYLVYISVTSTDAVRFRYLTARRACEQIVGAVGPAVSPRSRSRPGCPNSRWASLPACCRHRRAAGAELRRDHPRHPDRDRTTAASAEPAGARHHSDPGQRPAAPARCQRGHPHLGRIPRERAGRLASAS